MRKVHATRGNIKPRFGGWFRFYNDALDNPKVQLLPSDLFKTWVNLLCIASRFGFLFLSPCHRRRLERS